MFRPLFAAVVSALVTSAAHADVPHDKYLHVGASAAVAAAATTFAANSQNAVWYGLGAGAVVGVAKELVDRTRPHDRFDPKDVWADVVGTVAGTYLAHSFVRPLVQHKVNGGYAVGLQATVPLK
jgi:uncharacterized protein YfiM (DUF2279 family)